MQQSWAKLKISSYFCRTEKPSGDKVVSVFFHIKITSSACAKSE